MKITKYLIGIFSLIILFSGVIKAQEEMTEDEWQAEMQRLRDKKEMLTQELTTLRSEVENLQSQSNEMQTYEDCINELYALVGATEQDVNNFRKAVAELEGKIKRKEGPKKDRQADLDALKSNKISALPEFYTKVHIDLQRMLDQWVEEPQEIMYTVVRGDCLWNIAKKKEHYGNGFAWPVLYKANRDKIKNPDLIYPNQVFRVPPLTPEEKAKYEKLRANYKPAPKE